MSATPSITPLPDLPLTLDGVRIERLPDGNSLPLSAHPTKPGIDLAEWAMKSAEFIDSALLTSGAVLFRDFGPVSADSFRRFTDAVFAERMPYEFSLVQRPKISDSIYRATTLPPDAFLNIHNECIAHRNWPMRVAFCCMNPAERGGETPLADCRKVHDKFTPEVRDKFARLGVMYFRDTSKSELDKVFGTDSRPSIEESCELNDYGFEWDRRGGIHLRFIAQAIRKHPVMAEPVWFNYACIYIASRYSFIREPRPIPRPVPALPYERDKYDLNACFGDGSPIDDEAVFQVHNAYTMEAAEIPWRKGDILLLDNMLTAHGRNRFAGDRELKLAMGNPYDGMRSPSED